MLLGVDVSKYQSQDQIPRDSDFVIARACYGTHEDASAPIHALRARQIGASFGLYHFFRPDQDVALQFEAFERQSRACRINEGDVIPWVDIEAYTADMGRSWHHPAESWQESAHRMILMLHNRWGQCGIYGSQRDWVMMGRPTWWAERPIWVAHYRTTHGDPDTPGDAPWDMWQYRVGPWSPWSRHVIGEQNLAGAIDHNYAKALPLISRRAKNPVKTKSLQHLNMQLDWDELRRSRDAEYAERWGYQCVNVDMADSDYRDIRDIRGTRHD